MNRLAVHLLTAVALGFTSSHQAEAQSPGSLSHYSYTLHGMTALPVEYYELTRQTDGLYVLRVEPPGYYRLENAQGLPASVLVPRSVADSAAAVFAAYRLCDLAPSYAPPANRQVSDGYHWRLEATYEGCRVSSHGDNVFPAEEAFRTIHHWLDECYHRVARAQ